MENTGPNKYPVEFKPNFYRSYVIYTFVLFASTQTDHSFGEYIFLNTGTYISTCSMRKLVHSHFLVSKFVAEMTNLLLVFTENQNLVEL